MNDSLTIIKIILIYKIYIHCRSCLYRLRSLEGVLIGEKHLGGSYKFLYRFVVMHHLSLKDDY